MSKCLEITKTVEETLTVVASHDMTLDEFAQRLQGYIDAGYSVKIAFNNRIHYARLTKTSVEVLS